MLLAKEKRLAEIQLETLRRQLNPHFTFNAINSLQYFILKNETDLALDYLCRLSGLIRHTLDLSSKIYVPLADELSYLRAYMSIENTRVENRVSWEIHVEDKIDSQRVRIPPMLIHPFIENVFLHSFPLDHKGPKIEMDFILIDKDHICCTIQDNGVGFDPMCTSVGIGLVKERLDLMPSMKSQILTITSTMGKGTTIKLLLNYSLLP